MLCDDLAEWDGDGKGRRLKRMGIYVCIYLIHFTVHQKLTQHYKAIIFQFFKKESHFYNQNQTNKREKMRVRKRKERDDVRREWPSTAPGIHGF